MDLLGISISIVVGILTGILSSFLFLRFYLSQIRPKIEISDFICESVNEEGDSVFWFKFVNKTNSELYDVRVEPTFYLPTADRLGGNLIRTPLETKGNIIKHVPKKNKADPHNLHCCRVKTEHNLKDSWKEDSFLRLTIIAKHSMSGFHKVFVKDYDSISTITTKKFQSGDNLQVV